RMRVFPHRPLDPRAHHPSGTTRMHDDPREGVVDADLRVHGTANLHVAGSSVFPTAGFANPTLTAVALAMRLADHIARPVADRDGARADRDATRIERGAPWVGLAE